MTVLKDAADIVSGLVALDRRYEGVPGWEKLKEQGRLGRAAAVCAAHSGYDEPDYTVDLRGWRPATQPIEGPPMPGIAGVMQAEHNLLVGLHEFPDARSLRVVMDSQRFVASETSRRVGAIAPELAAKWAARADTYLKLLSESRDLGGILGKGIAAGTGAVAASRAQRLGVSEATDTRALRQLDRLFDRIDDKVANIVERGANDRIYFLRVPLPRVDHATSGLVKRPRERYVPITSPVQTELIAIIRNELRPEPVRLRG